MDQQDVSYTERRENMRFSYYVIRNWYKWVSTTFVDDQAPSVAKPAAT